MRLITKDDVQVLAPGQDGCHSGWGFYAKSTGELLSGKGTKGVNKRLFAYRPPSPEQKARMERGIAKHSDIEHGKCDHAGLLAWQAKQKALQSTAEVFVHGDLFGQPTIGYLDNVMQDADGDWIITDYKFTGCKPDVAERLSLDKYAPVQICYAKLFFDTYGIKIARCNVLNLFEDGTSLEVQLPRADFGKYYAFAKALNAKLRAS